MPAGRRPWRGRSGRRYVVSVNDAWGLDPETVAVVLAVARDPAGVAAILAVGTAPGFAVPAGTSELHVHRLAETDDDRAAIVADLALMTVADAISAMLALYATPGTWIREGVAQDAAGKPVAATSPKAVAWSLEGALDRVIEDVEDPDVAWSENQRRQALLSDVFKACGADLAALNDTVRHQRVVVGVLQAGKDHVAAR